MCVCVCNINIYIYIYENTKIKYILKGAGKRLRVKNTCSYRGSIPSAYIMAHSHP